MSKLKNYQEYVFESNNEKVSKNPYAGKLEKALQSDNPIQALLNELNDTLKKKKDTNND